MTSRPVLITPRPDGVRLALHVKPRASKSALVGAKEGALVVSLRAAPVDGAANDELLGLLAEALGVRRAAIAIATGATGRRKLVDVSGLSLEEAQRRVAQHV